MLCLSPSLPLSLSLTLSLAHTQINFPHSRVRCTQVGIQSAQRRHRGPGGAVHAGVAELPRAAAKHKWPGELRRRLNQASGGKDPPPPSPFSWVSAASASKCRHAQHDRRSSLGCTLIVPRGGSRLVPPGILWFSLLVPCLCFRP